MVNSLVDEVLGRVDIVDVISRYIPLKRAGSNFSACCPFHWEKTPSFMVSPTKQIFKCFGCWKWWNVFTFVQEIERIDFRDAVKVLAEQEHIDVSQYQQVSAYAQKSQDDKEKLKRMQKLAQEFFVESLKNSKTALDYLHEKRHLDDKLISGFWIWYAKDKHYELMNLLRSKWFNDDDLLEASLGKKNANGEICAFFRNRITFPIYDLMKNVVWFSARIFNWEIDAPKYINSSENKLFEKSKILYGLSHAKQYINTHQKLIVVEWQMDVIWLARLWFPIWVATSGTALTEQHIKILKRHTENLYLLFDNDQAGRDATFRALKLCYAQDLFPRIISLPDWFKDADELANHENWSQLFQECIDKATDWFLEMFDRLRSSFDMNSPIDKTKLINKMFELIITINSQSSWNEKLEILANKLGYPNSAFLRWQFDKYWKWWWSMYLSRVQNRMEAEEKYKIDKEQLFSSLFFENYINKQLWENSDFLKSLNEFLSLFSKAEEDSLVVRVINNKLTEDEILNMDEQQLRREKEFWDNMEVDTKVWIIWKTIASVIQEFLKLATKSRNLTDDEKKQLIILKWKLGRR